MSEHPRNQHGWRQEAACRGKGFDLFFQHSTSAALEVCDRCAVTLPCLIFRLKDVPSSEDSGVWGGTQCRARKALRQELQAAGLIEMPLRADDRKHL